ncbi:MAG: hypothetical protein P1U42_07000 [Phycisphaerales bacterium]|nr:hypothetical protein [Phycisphaerales bacterium]
MGREKTNSDWLDQVDERVDLRRRRESSHGDRLVRRAHWLEPADRELVLAMFRDGKSAVTISQLMNESPRNIRRRVRKLIERLNDPRVAYVVAHHKGWSKSRRAIAHSLFIKGKSMRETTEELGLSFYSVRKHRETIEAMCVASNNSSHSRIWRTSH